MTTLRGSVTNCIFLPFSVEKKNDFDNIWRKIKKESKQMFFPSNDQGRFGSIVLAIASVFISAQVQGKVYYLNTSEAGDSYGCWNDSSKWSETYERTVNGEGKNVWTFSGENPSEFTAADDFVVPALSTGYTLRDAGGTGKIIEWMADRGYVSEFDGAKARKCLLTKEGFENLYGPL